MKGARWVAQLEGRTELNPGRFSGKKNISNHRCRRKGKTDVYLTRNNSGARRLYLTDPD